MDWDAQFTQPSSDQDIDHQYLTKKSRMRISNDGNFKPKALIIFHLCLWVKVYQGFILCPSGSFAFPSMLQRFLPHWYTLRLCFHIKSTPADLATLEGNALGKTRTSDQCRQVPMGRPTNPIISMTMPSGADPCQPPRISRQGARINSTDFCRTFLL